MNYVKSKLGNFTVFAIPLSIMVLMIMIIITKLPIFQEYSEKLSRAIIVDSLLIVPTIYFFLIRKKKIPNFSVVSFFVAGIVICSLIIPKENQQLLSLIKTWFLPIVEISVFTFILYKVRKTIKKYRSANTVNSDFFDTIKTTINEDFPKKIAAILAMEIGVFYYGCIYWRKRSLQSNEFSYHKNSGTISLLVALLLIIGIETYVLHMLLLKWSSVAAWFISFLSIYSGIQIFGFMKSLSKRPIVVTPSKVCLRYGILSETVINLEHIKYIEVSSSSINFAHTTRKLSPLGELESHNMVIHLYKEHTLYGLYGTKKKFTSLAFFADQPEKLKAHITNSISIAKDLENLPSRD